MEELMERIAGWVRKVIRPELDAALAQPVPLAGEDVAMIRGLIASVEAVKKVQTDLASRVRVLEAKQ